MEPAVLSGSELVIVSVAAPAFLFVLKAWVPSARLRQLFVAAFCVAAGAASIALDASLGDAHIQSAVAAAAAICSAAWLIHSRFFGAGCDRPETSPDTGPQDRPQ